MKRYHLLVYEPNSYTSDSTLVFRVEIGENMREKALRQQAETLMAKEPTSFYFHLYDTPTFEFMMKLIDKDLERVGQFDTRQMLDFIRLKVNHPNTQS